MEEGSRKLEEGGLLILLNFLMLNEVKVNMGVSN